MIGTYPRNLDTAVRQAKFLLKDFRSGDSARTQTALQRLRAFPPLSQFSEEDLLHGSHRVQLKHAQHVLAREWGFNDWAELKRELYSGESILAPRKPAFLLPLFTDLDYDLIGGAVFHLTPSLVDRLRSAQNAASLAGAGAEIAYGDLEPDAVVDLTNLSEHVLHALEQVHDLGHGFVPLDAEDLVILDNGDPDYPAGLTEMGRLRAVRFHASATSFSWSGIVSHGHHDDDTRVRTHEADLTPLVGESAPQEGSLIGA